MDKIFKKYSLINQIHVSRETCLDFEKYISMIEKENKNINIISKETDNIEMIRHRHIIDTAQAIDFVNLKSNTTCDLGSGGGFPGVVMAIILKNMKKNLKVILYEKSHHKSSFLRKVSRKLNLDTEVIQEDIYKLEEINTGTIMARAFKPLPIVLDLISKNFSSYKNLIIFMGKNGKKVLEETLKIWDFDYEKKRSVTSENSFLINIKNIRRRI